MKASIFAIMLVACASSNASDRVVDVTPTLGVVQVIEASDAGDTPGCPEGARWNGRVCRGVGFVACRTGERLEGTKCVTPLPPVSTADLTPLPPAPTSMAVHSPVDTSSTGAIECDRFLEVYERCFLRTFPRRKEMVEEQREAMRIQLAVMKGRDRESIRQNCELARKHAAAKCRP